MHNHLQQLKHFYFVELLYKIFQLILARCNSWRRTLILELLFPKMSHLAKFTPNTSPLWSICKSHSNFFEWQIIGAVFDSNNYDFYPIGFLHSYFYLIKCSYQSMIQLWTYLCKKMDIWLLNSGRHNICMRL